MSVINSLTYTNNLPILVENVGQQKGIVITTSMVAKPNYGLEDHWNDGVIQNLIEKESFNYVIIQQGPSSQAYGRASLLEYGRKIAALCKINNTKMGYFMVWPSLTYYHTFEGVIKNHKDAAIANEALLFPVGEVWKTYFDNTKDLSYYGSDGFHPSLKGSEAAANVIIELL